MKHIHCGAGKFGLGFVVWLLASKCGAATTVCNRSDAPGTVSARKNDLLRDQHSYVVLYDVDPKLSEDYKPLRVRFDKFFEWAADAQPSASLLAEHCDVEEVLVTISLERFENYLFPLNLIRQLTLPGAANSSRRRIYVLPCENFDAAPQLKEELGKILSPERFGMVTVLEASVDRMCVAFEEIEGILAVKVEPAASLVIEERAEASRLYDFLSKSGVVSVSKQIKLERAKKLYIYNGSHALVGALAFDQGIPHINDFLSDDLIGVPGRKSLKERRRAAGALLNEMADGFIAWCRTQEGGAVYLANYFDGSARDRYLAETLARMTETHDQTDRVIRRFRSAIPLPASENGVEFQNTIVDFLSWLRDRVLDPAAAYVQSYGYPPSEVCSTLARIFDLMSRNEFLDRRKFRQ